jgi:hypothetical protein
VLAWWLLWRGGLSGATAPQLDAAAEAWLKGRCGIAADFEVSDALAKLQRLQIANESSCHWRAIAIEKALETLDRAWDQQFQYHQPIEVASQPRFWRPAA